MNNKDLLDELLRQFLKTPENSAEFESYCYEIYQQWLKREGLAENQCQWSIKHEKLKCPIDIIVTRVDCRPAGELPLPGEVEDLVEWEEEVERHFIECKFYTEKLSLEVVAKPILVALRFYPKSLTIATRTELSPQAREYSKAVLELEPHRHRRIKLKIWRPLSPSRYIAGSPSLVENIDKNNFNKHFKINDWAIVECGVFGDIPYNMHSVNPNSRLIIKVNLSAAAESLITSGDSITVCLTATSPEGAENVFIPMNVKSELDSCFELEGLVEPGDLAYGTTYCLLKLIIKTKTIDTENNFPGAPAIRISELTPDLPDLRRQETADIYNSWRHSPRSPILLVQGAGGVGKTHLCHRLCQMAAADNFVAYETSMNYNTNTGFLANLIWRVLQPQLKEILSEHESILTDLLETTYYVRSGGQELPPEQLRSIAKLLTSGELDDAPSEALLGGIARFIVKKGTPVMVYVNDVHHATPTSLACLQMLIKGFDDADWGAVKIILEKRDLPSNLTQDVGGRLWDWLETFYKNKVHKAIVVNPIRTEIMSTALQKIIVAADAVNVSEHISRKTCGNPLNVINCFKNLLEQKIMTPEHGKSDEGVSTLYRVRSLSDFKDALINHQPDNIRLIMDRIEQRHSVMMAAGFRLGGYLLGIIGIMDITAPYSVLESFGRYHAGMDLEAELNTLINDGFLVQNFDGYTFTHESVGDAARLWLQKRDEAIKILTELVRCSQNPSQSLDYQACIARGRLFAYLGSFPKALEAFNAALQKSGTNYVMRYTSHLEIHKLLLKTEVKGFLHHFFENFKALTWYGQYTLPITSLIGLLRDALKRLRESSLLDYQEPLRSETQFDLCHRISWFSVRTMEFIEYRKYTFEALDSAETLYDLSRLIGKEVKMCSLTGQLTAGRAIGMLAIAINDLIPEECNVYDGSLLSVTYGELGAMIALYSQEASLHLSKLACAGRPGRTERQEAHDYLNIGRSQLRMGYFDEAQENLARAREIANALSLDRMDQSMYICDGILAAVKKKWEYAAEAFKRAMSGAAWLSDRMDAIKAGQNLLAAYHMAGKTEQAQNLYEYMLHEAASNPLAFNTEQTDLFFNVISERARELVDKLARRQGPTFVSLDELMAMAENQYHLPWPEGKCVNIYTSFFKNVLCLHHAEPAIYKSPLYYGINSALLDESEQSEPCNTLPVCDQSGLTLNLTC